ncbi:hypothetical protein D3C85_1004670 [compost metagenome]
MPFGTAAVPGRRAKHETGVQGVECMAASAGVIEGLQGNICDQAVEVGMHMRGRRGQAMPMAPRPSIGTPRDDGVR